MKPPSTLISNDKLYPVRRLRIVAAAALLALAVAITILSLVIPSFAQSDPSGVEAVDIITVDKDATGAQTGESWEDAFITIQDALDIAVGAEIWVAEGIYYPDEGTGETNGDRTATFQLKPGVTIYGGFDGTENLLEERDWVNNVTVLSGDLDKNDTTDANGVVTETAKIVGTDNAYHVVTAEDVMVSAKLNGFVITAGLADSTVEAADHKGAGIYCYNAAPALANLIIQGNEADGELLLTPEGYGGGMHNFSSGPQFSNVTFRNNFARTSGGGLYTTDSGGGITSLIFEGNVAGSSGGGMYLATSLGHTLSNLTFTANSAVEYGGGLYVQSGVQSSLGNSTLASNTAVSGGGIYLDASIFSLSSVDFVTNIASDRGGGLFAQLGTYSLTGVTFDGNQATTTGGGVHADRNVGTLTVSVFMHNTSIQGAGMYVDDQDNEYANLTMDSTLFVDNIASQDGAGLYVVDSPQGTLDGVSFLYNEATDGYGGGMFLLNSDGYELSNTDFDGNEAIAGGGMFVEASSPTLTNLSFEDNRAQLTYVDDTLGGGGIYLLDGSEATFSGATFSENEAANGGGMFIADSNPTLTNVSFAGNQAGDGVSGSGGGLWNHEGSPTLTNVLFGGNKATQDGGGMLSSGAGSNVAIINATFSGNAAGGSGGGLSTTSPNMLIDNTVIWNNQDSSGIGTAGASLSGLAVINYSLIQGQTPPGTGNLDGTNPANNPQFVIPVDPTTAPTASGDLSVKYGSPIVDVANNAVIPPGVTLDLAGNTRIYNGTVDMGAYELQLACPPPETTLLHVDHTASGNNTGTSWLDALEDLRDAFTLADECEGIVEIWVAEGVYRPDEGVGMVPSSRTETYQLIDGVAVYGGFDGTEILLEERDSANNVTVLSGDVDGNDINVGGIVLDPGNIRGSNSYHVLIASSIGDTAVLDGFTITAGQANGSTPNQTDRGAGLYNDASSPTLVNLTFTGSFAENGGGLANVNGSNPPMSDVQFQSNTAGSLGGAIYNEASHPSLTGIQFQNNAAGSNGGAIYNKDSDPSLTGVQFQSNTSGSYGCAICNEDSDPSLANALLSGNTASAGAAIYNNASHPSLTNALLSGNFASAGAAIHNTASNPILVNVTVTGNRASSSAGGMFNTSTSQPTVHNSIFWGNQDSTGTGTASATIHNEDAGSISLINYSLVQALSGIEHTGANNLDQYPWFTTPLDPSAAPTTAGDLTLGVFSPAIDVGDNAANSTLTDLAGNPRTINGIIDLGAYEAPYRPVYHTYLPVVLRDYP